jgi:hypothetical protein
MVNLATYAKRVRRNRMLGMIIFLGSALMLGTELLARGLPTPARLEAAIPWVFGLGAGLVFYYFSLELPKQEILQLAESRHGLLTLSEIATTLNVDPDLVLRTLRHMQKSGLATPRWTELQRNLWEFPDYVKLPIDETITMARDRGGRVSLQDLVARGHSLDTAQQTFDALSDKGLAQRDTADTRSLIVETG